MHNTLSAKANFVHVWSAVLDIGTDIQRACQALLSVEERDKASRFHLEQDAVHYIAAHGFLRSLLAPYLRTKPEHIRFERGLYGKPVLHQMHDMRELCFNLSHSGGVALCAISYKRNIGVDIEKKRYINDWNVMARHCFAREEWESLESLPQEERMPGFIKLWTQKEAYIKALGQGLSYPLQKFCVPYRRGDTPILAYDWHDPRQHGQWEFHNIPTTNNHIATVVVEGPDTLARPNTWTW